jgi:hypothetical protein
MADLNRLFEDLDRLDAPVSWPEVKRHHPGPPMGEPALPKRMLTIGLALAIGAAGISLVLRAFVFAPSQPVAPPTATPRPHSTPNPSPSPPPPGWVRHTDDAGVSIDTPADWTFNGDPVPALAEPAMLFAVGTGPVPTGGDCAPRPAIEALPKDGVLFTLQEYGNVDEPYTFPLRPDQFDIGSLVGPFECFGVKANDIEFQDGSRFFQVFAMFGPDAPPSLRQEVEQSLDSISVNPLPASAQPTADCRRGQWTSCPEDAWVYQVIDRAHVAHLGHRGVQAILGVVGKRSFALWTTSSSGGWPSGQCLSVAGGRCARSARGLCGEPKGSCYGSSLLPPPIRVFAPNQVCPLGPYSNGSSGPPRACSPRSHRGPRRAAATMSRPAPTQRSESREDAGMAVSPGHNSDGPVGRPAGAGRARNEYSRQRNASKPVRAVLLVAILASLVPQARTASGTDHPVVHLRVRKPRATSGRPFAPLAPHRLRTSRTT